ncbi:hypothetical protein CXB35_23400 [Pseudomonas syringae]|nr:hypothetical protein CXB35_23400 [Pseudomonas syringae]
MRCRIHLVGVTFFPILLTVQIQAGDNWITTDTLWKDGGYQLSIPPATIRYVPAAGAAFEVYA